MQIFVRQITGLIKEKGKQLNQKKKQAIKRIKDKDITGTCFDYSKHAAPINKCTNSRQLAEKEQEITQEIEQFSRQAQASEVQRKKQEEKNERLKKEEETKQQKQQEEWEKRHQEEVEFLRLSSLIFDSQDLTTLEKNCQVVKNSPLYTTNKKSFAESKEDNKTTLDNYYKNKKNLFLSSQEKLNNHKNGENPNDLKSKFYEIYQKEKKYTWIELMRLLDILREVEKETSLDEHLRDAKKELQTIFDKIKPYRHEISFITSRGEKVEDMLKGLEKHELENCKKVLEETGKVICLNEWEKYLIGRITDELKITSLKSEIQDLKNQNSGTQTAEQQAETQRKIEEKERELEEVKKNKENKQEPTPISQEVDNAENQILQSLKDHNLKTTDLPKKYQNWKEQLSKLTTKEEIDSLVSEINQQIENKLKELKQNQKGNNHQQPISLTTKLLIGGIGLMVIGLGAVILISERRGKKTKFHK